MSVALPWCFLLFLPLFAFLFLHLKGSQSNALRYSSLSLFDDVPRSARQRFAPLPFWLRFMALVFLIIAMARPQLLRTVEAIPREGIAIELAVDISSSMDFTMPYGDNESLSRMEVTKKVLEQFVGGTEDLRGRPNDLIGLVTFARYADTICPLTLGHDSLLYLIQDLEIESRPNEDGTAFGDALALSAARLKTVEERYNETDAQEAAYTVKSKVIILVTDGSNNCGRHLPMDGAALAQKWGIRVHTIAITDPPNFRSIETPEGTVQIEEEAPAQERVLRQIAETTGGIYRRASDETSLRDVYQEIDAMESSEIHPLTYHRQLDVFHPFAIAALFLLSLQALLTTTWLRRIP